MRFRVFLGGQVFAVCACLMLAAAFSAATASAVARAAAVQDKAAASAPKLSDGEIKAADKVNKAADAAAKLQAGSEFIKKYPKSTLRPQVAGYISSQIVAVQDPAQRIALSEQYLKQFTGADEGDIINNALIDAYVAGDRFDDAFRVGSTWLSAKPDDAQMMTILSLHGIEQARRGNKKFSEQSQQYALKAIQLFEANQRPASFDEARWNQLKQNRLPQIYQSLGVLALLNSNPAEALPRFQKAAALNQADPLNYFFIGGIKNEEYQKLADLYQKSAPANQGEVLKLVHQQLDEIMELYARTVALSAGKEQFKQMHDQALSDLQSYYKFRHKSTDGLQQLIDKYKQPAASQ